MFAILGILLIIAILYLLGSSGNSTPEPKTKKLVYDGSEIYYSKSLVYTSNGTTSIVYGDDTGLFYFDIDSGQKTKLSSDQIIGLAHDINSKKYFVLKSNNKLYTFSDSSKVLNYYDENIRIIYDTNNGYFIQYVSGESFYLNSGRTRNSGNYGTVNFLISNV